MSPAKVLKSNRAASINVSNYELQNCEAPGWRQVSAKKRSKTKSKSRLSLKSSVAVSDHSRSPNGVSTNVGQYSFKDLAVSRLKKQES
jgi:hypothetical protein